MATHCNGKLTRSITIRADSGFCRERVMAWCEANGVDYVLGLARNVRLQKTLAPELAQAKAIYEETGQAARVFKDFEFALATACRLAASRTPTPFSQTPAASLPPPPLG